MDRRSSDTMNERRMQCTVVFLIKMLYIYMGSAPRAQRARAEAAERGDRGGRGERGERGPGYQERLTDSREAIYLERVELAMLTPPCSSSVGYNAQTGQKSSNNAEGNPLVMMSASYCRVGTWSTRTSPTATFSRTKWTSSSTCFVRPWCTGFSER